MILNMLYNYQNPFEEHLRDKFTAPNLSFLILHTSHTILCHFLMNLKCLFKKVPHPRPAYQKMGKEPKFTDEPTYK